MQIEELSYLKRIRIARIEKQRQIAETPKPPTLAERVESWYSGLSEEEKGRAWTMVDLKAIFHATPQALAQCLWGQGWTRKRSFADGRPTARYWLKE